MYKTEEGRQLLGTRRQLNDTEISVDKLRQLEEGTFGREIINFMDAHSFDPFKRPQVRYIEDEELAYVMQRYRQVHDLWHVLAGLPPTVLGEVAIKWMELVQTGLPMTAFAGVFGPLRLKVEEQIFLATTLLPWAAKVATTTPFLLSVHYEDMFEEDLDKIRNMLHFDPAPQIPSDLNQWTKDAVNEKLPEILQQEGTSVMQQEKASISESLNNFWNTEEERGRV